LLKIPKISPQFQLSRLIEVKEKKPIEFCIFGICKLHDFLR